MILPAFWHAAALLAGRVDLSRLECPPGADPPPTLQQLAAAGLPPHQLGPLLSGQARALDDAALVLTDPDYPALLRATPLAPPVLFLRGDRGLLHQPCVAIVGSRRCTSTGQRMARLLARAVVDGGGVVVSGLAHGIDEAAHGACPERTIAVLGQGLDQPLLPAQRRLAAEILAAGGLVLTEFLPEVPPARWTFPQRNRIIAGLARGTVVVEAARKSGALITARQALATGREVLAVPASPLAPASEGCLDLIAAGAGLARDGADLRALLPRRPTAPRGASAPPGPTLPPGFHQGLQGGASLDELAQAAGWPVERAGATLAALELTGVVQRLPGERFSWTGSR